MWKTRGNSTKVFASKIQPGAHRGTGSLKSPRVNKSSTPVRHEGSTAKASDLATWRFSAERKIQRLKTVENDTFRWNVLKCSTHSAETARFAVIICSPHIEFESTIFYSSPVLRPRNHTKPVPWPCQIGCSTWNLLPSSSITQRNSPASALSSTSPGLTISQKRRDLLGWQTSWIFRSVWFIAASWLKFDPEVPVVGETINMKHVRQKWRVQDCCSIGKRLQCHQVEQFSVVERQEKNWNMYLEPKSTMRSSYSTGDLLDW